MARVVNQKVEQLDKAICNYNLENEKLGKVRKEQEQILKKLRVEQREMDSKRKKDADELEKLKQEE